MKIALLILTCILCQPFAFAHNDPPEYGPIDYKTNVCIEPPPTPPFRQYGETWCSYSRRFSVYKEYFSEHVRRIRSKCGNQVRPVRAIKSWPKVNDNLNCY